MFQPETEDMLPRMAPKPSASSEAMVRPQVPEISIIFGQLDGNEQQQQNYNIQRQMQTNSNVPQPSYAAWKKQMLPKVNYQAAGLTQETQLQENGSNNNNGGIKNYNMPTSNLYPFRSTTTPVSVQTNGFGITTGGATNPLTYRRSLESCSNNNNIAYQQISQHYQLQQQSPRQVLPVTPTLPQNPTNSPRDVLTICAGTQTEETSGSQNMAQAISDIPWQQLASKKDVEDVLHLVQDMRHEQLRIMKMLETILFSPQMAPKPESRDMGVQVDTKEKENLQNVNVGGTQNIVQQPAVTNKFIQHLKPSPNNILQSPKGKPMAQSTTYRPNSPQNQRYQEVASAPNYQQHTNGPPVLTKSSSDTSLAMNELALKYLPNEKLAELLNELNMECPLPPTKQNHLPEPPLAVTNNPSTPVRGNVEKFERGPSDISNASYKYLKKYRLLPEDHSSDGHVVDEDSGENINENNSPQYNSPHRQQHQQFDNLRNSPNNQRQAPAKCSPYAGRLPLSPLVRASPKASIPQHIVDLENIKYQPKFL